MEKKSDQGKNWEQFMGIADAVIERAVVRLTGDPKKGVPPMTFEESIALAHQESNILFKRKGVL